MGNDEYQGGGAAAVLIGCWMLALIAMFLAVVLAWAISVGG